MIADSFGQNNPLTISDYSVPVSNSDISQPALFTAEPDFDRNVHATSNSPVTLLALQRQMALLTSIVTSLPQLQNNAATQVEPTFEMDISDGLSDVFPMQEPSQRCVHYRQPAVPVK